jgi:hypothetical protein
MISSILILTFSFQCEFMWPNSHLLVIHHDYIIHVFMPLHFPLLLYSTNYLKANLHFFHFNFLVFIQSIKIYIIPLMNFIQNFYIGFSKVINV